MSFAVKDLDKPLAGVAEKWTTIRVTDDVANLIKKRFDYHDNNMNDTLRRFLTGDAELWFEFVSIDGEGPKTTPHEIFFQLGDKPPHFYRFLNGCIEPVSKPPRMLINK